MSWEEIQLHEKKKWSALTEEAKGEKKISNQVHFKASKISSLNIKMHIQNS